MDCRLDWGIYLGGDTVYGLSISEKGGAGFIGNNLGCCCYSRHAPWQYLLTAYWKLLLAPYGMFFIAIVWAVWSYGSIESLNLNWWNLLWLIPALSPFGMLSKRKWAVSDSQQGASAEAETPPR
jgi:hypothetical protein